MATAASPSRKKSVPAAQLTFVLLEGPHVSRLARGATLHVPKNAVEISVYPYWTAAELSSALRKGLAPTLPRSANYDLLIADGTGKKLVEPPHDEKSGMSGFAVLSAVFADKKSTLNKFLYVRPSVKVDLEDESESSEESSSSDEEVVLAKKPRSAKPSSAGHGKQSAKKEKDVPTKAHVRSSSMPSKAVGPPKQPISLAQRRERRRSSDSSSSGKYRLMSQGGTSLKRSKSSDSDSSSPVKKTKIDLRGAMKVVAVDSTVSARKEVADDKSAKKSSASKLNENLKQMSGDSTKQKNEEESSDKTWKKSSGSKDIVQKKENNSKVVAKKSAEKKKAAAVNLLRGGAKLKIKMPFKPARSPPSSPVKTPKVKSKTPESGKASEKVIQGNTEAGEKQKGKAEEERVETSEVTAKTGAGDYEVTTIRPQPSGPFIKRVFVPPISELLKPTARINSASSPVTCLDCGERAPNWNALSAHKRNCAAANKVTRFACSQCEFKTTMKGKIDEHMFIAHGAIRKDMLQPVSSAAAASAPATVTAAEAISRGSFVINICGACNKVFSNPLELERHNTIFHPASEISQISVGRDGIKVDERHDLKSISGNPFLRAVYGNAIGGGGSPSGSGLVPESPSSSMSPSQMNVTNKGQPLPVTPGQTLGTPRKDGQDKMLQLVSSSTPITQVSSEPVDKSGSNNKQPPTKDIDETDRSSSEKDSQPLTVKRVIMPIKQVPSQRAQTMINRAMERASQRAKENALTSTSPKSTLADANYRPFRCAERGCCVAFFKLQDKLQHEAVAHGRCHVCEGCKQSFQSQFILEKHRLLCPAVCRYCCQECGMPFKSPAILDFHFLKFHKNPDDAPPVGCADCGKSFISYRSFVVHRQILHRDENIFLKNVIPQLRTSEVLESNTNGSPKNVVKPDNLGVSGTVAEPAKEVSSKVEKDKNEGTSSSVKNKNEKAKQEEEDEEEEEKSEEEDDDEGEEDEEESSDEEDTPRKLRSVSTRKRSSRRSSRLASASPKKNKLPQHSPRRTSLRETLVESKTRQTPKKGENAKKIDSSPRKSPRKSVSDPPATKHPSKEISKGALLKNVTKTGVDAAAGKKSEVSSKVQKGKKTSAEVRVSPTLLEQVSDLDSSVSSVRSLVLGTVQAIDTLDDIEIKQEKDDDHEYDVKRDDENTGKKTWGKYQATSEQSKGATDVNKAPLSAGDIAGKDNQVNTGAAKKVTVPAKRGRPPLEERAAQAKKAKVEEIKTNPKADVLGSKSAPESKTIPAASSNAKTSAVEVKEKTIGKQESASAVPPLVIDRSKELLQHKMSIAAGEVGPDQPKRQGFIITEKQMKELVAGGPQALNDFVKKHLLLAKSKEAGKAIVKMKTPEPTQESAIQEKEAHTVGDQQKTSSKIDVKHTGKSIKSAKSGVVSKDVTPKPDETKGISDAEHDTDKNLSDSDEQDDEQTPRRSSRMRKPSKRLKEAQESLSEDDDKFPSVPPTRTRSGSGTRIGDATSKQPDSKSLSKVEKRSTQSSSIQVEKSMQRSTDQRVQRKTRNSEMEQDKEASNNEPEKAQKGKGSEVRVNKSSKKSNVRDSQDSSVVSTLQHLVKTTGGSLQLQTALGLRGEAKQKELHVNVPTDDDPEISFNPPKQISPELHPGKPISIAPLTSSQTHDGQASKSPPSQQRSAVDYLQNMLQMTKQASSKSTGGASPGQINIGEATAAKSLGTVGGSVTINTGEENPYQVYVEHSADGSNIQISLRKVDPAPASPTVSPSPTGGKSPGIYVGTIGGSKEKHQPSPLASPSVADSPIPQIPKEEKTGAKLAQSTPAESGKAATKPIENIQSRTTRSKTNDQTPKSEEKQVKKSNVKSKDQKSIEKQTAVGAAQHGSPKTSSGKTVKFAPTVPEVSDKSKPVEKAGAGNVAQVSTQSDSIVSNTDNKLQTDTSSPKMPTVVKKVIGKNLTKEQLMEFVRSGKFRLVQKTDAPLPLVMSTPQNTTVGQPEKSIESPEAVKTSAEGQTSIPSSEAESPKSPSSKPKVLVVRPQQMTRTRSASTVEVSKSSAAASDSTQSVISTPQTPVSAPKVESITTSPVVPAKLPQRNVVSPAHRIPPTRHQAVTYTVTPQQPTPRSYAPKPQQMSQTKQVVDPATKLVPVSPIINPQVVAKTSVAQSPTPSPVKKSTQRENSTEKPESSSAEPGTVDAPTKVIEIKRPQQSVPPPSSKAGSQEVSSGGKETTTVTSLPTQKTVSTRAAVKSTTAAPIQPVTALPKESTPVAEMLTQQSDTKEMPVRQTRATSVQDPTKSSVVQKDSANAKTSAASVHNPTKSPVVPQEATRTKTRAASHQTPTKPQVVPKDSAVAQTKAAKLENQISSPVPVKESAGPQTKIASIQNPSKSPVVHKESSGPPPKVIVYPAHMRGKTDLQKAAPVASGVAQAIVSDVQSAPSVSTVAPSASQAVSPTPIEPKVTKQDPIKPSVMAKSSQPVKKILKITPEQLQGFLKMQNISSAKSFALTPHQMQLLLKRSVVEGSTSGVATTTTTTSSGGSSQNLQTDVKLATSEINGKMPSGTNESDVSSPCPQKAVTNPSLVTEVHGEPVLSSASQAINEMSTALRFSPAPSEDDSELPVSKQIPSVAPPVASEQKAAAGKRVPGFRLQCDVCLNPFFNVAAWEAHLPTCTEPTNQAQTST